MHKFVTTDNAFIYARLNYETLNTLHRVMIVMSFNEEYILPSIHLSDISYETHTTNTSVTLHLQAMFNKSL